MSGNSLLTHYSTERRKGDRGGKGGTGREREREEIFLGSRGETVVITGWEQPEVNGGGREGGRERERERERYWWN